MPFCSICGQQVLDGSVFCSKCGERMMIGGPVQPPPQPPQPQYQPQQPPQPQYPPQQPPQPQYQKPPLKGSKTGIKIAAIVVFAIIISASVLTFVFWPKGSNLIKDDNPTHDSTPRIINTGAYIIATSGQIGAAGGTLNINNLSSPLNGFKVEVPNAVAPENINFSVKYADVTDVQGLPSGASIASKMIEIETSGSGEWNQFKMFDSLVKVTLPYDPGLVKAEEKAVRFYQYDETNHSLEPTGFAGQDLTTNTLSFYAATFSKFVAVELIMEYFESTNSSLVVDTGFRPANDGWFIPNYGSYLESGGVCLGMTSFAKWYYAREKSNTGTGLHSKYREGEPAEWRDDATAIQLATRAQTGLMGIWASLTQVEKENHTSKQVGLSIIHGMIVSGEPQLIGLKTRYNDGSWADGGHAILAYKYNQGCFDMYDPNNPGTAAGTNQQQIPYTYNGGFERIFESGLNAANPLQFNIFYHASAKVYSPDNSFRGIYNAAEQGFSGSSIFPTVTLTDSTTTPSGTTPIDTDNDLIRDTTSSKETISGTITGGQRNVSSTLIFVSNQKFETPVVDGAFSQVVPLYQGDNDIVILATDSNTFTDWAGFLRDTIKSTASLTSLTMTMTWGQDNSDVDLHVKEPTINSTEGRHIYYSNKGSDYDNHPYLDFDNTYGYGPEHYYATENMTLPESEPLYGTYLIRIHYFADHDSDYENTQPITWHLNIKYLAFKNQLTGQEFWGEVSYSGYLSIASTSDTGNFNNAGASWSQIYSFQYLEPVASNYGVPNPPQNQFS
ncbi:MAG: zinc-ribbon domain-containing protein [Candidatus Thermoplasmatota archaeon]|nr:zinc-ribbon domain-containing protein [Candidatus Thermoplasmatota archaeon]